MADRRDYYDVLGVPRDADAKTIKSAFRRLARRYHPDTSTELESEHRFREIAEAYGVLSDPAKRASYDARGFAGVAGTSAEDLWGGINLGDIFGAAAPGFEGLFEELFGRARGGPQRGADLRVDLTISLRQVLTGGKQAVSISRPGPCPDCGGSGARQGTTPRSCPDCGGTGQQAAASRRGSVLVRQLTTCPACQGRGQVIDQPCPACQGTGRAIGQDTVIVRIPRGIPDGTALRLAGRGMPSPVPGGPPGDAYLIIRTLPDPLFVREDADLWHTLHIGVPDAVLGTTVTVPALDGQAQLPVPPGTQSGAVLAIKGKGLPRYRGHGRGSLNVTVIVDIPQQPSPRQRRLYEQIRAGGAEAEASGPGLAPGTRPDGRPSRSRCPERSCTRRSWRQSANCRLVRTAASAGSLVPTGPSHGRIPVT
jgi:molecular chaperone DnaJ